MQSVCWLALLVCRQTRAKITSNGCQKHLYNCNYSIAHDHSVSLFSQTSPKQTHWLNIFTARYDTFLHMRKLFVHLQNCSKHVRTVSTRTNVLRTSTNIFKADCYIQTQNLFCKRNILLELINGMRLGKSVDECHGTARYRSVAWAAWASPQDSGMS